MRKKKGKKRDVTIGSTRARVEDRRVEPAPLRLYPGGDLHYTLHFTFGDIIRHLTREEFADYVAAQAHENALRQFDAIKFVSPLAHQEGTL